LIAGGQTSPGSRHSVRRAAIAIAITLSLLWVLFPLYWAAITSFKSRADFFGNSWLPFVSFRPTLGSWRQLFARSDLAESMLNSIVIAGAAATLAVLLGVPAAYGIARCAFPHRWRVGMVLFFVALRVFPPVLLVTPYLLLTHQFGLRDTTTGLALVNATLNLPLAVIIMSGAFLDVPRALEEAAWVDGATRFGGFVRIGLPLVAPAVTASWLLCLAFSWNESMFANALSFSEARSMPVLVISSGGGSGVNFGAASTRTLAVILLPMAVALAAQRYIVRGLSLGALKG